MNTEQTYGAPAPDANKSGQPAKIGRFPSEFYAKWGGGNVVELPPSSSHFWAQELDIDFQNRNGELSEASNLLYVLHNAINEDLGYLENEFTESFDEKKNFSRDNLKSHFGPGNEPMYAMGRLKVCTRLIWELGAAAADNLGRISELDSPQAAK